jgi:hypothetical protein
MSRKNIQNYSRFLLMRRRDNPIKRVRVMQINGLSSSPTVSLRGTKVAQPAQSASDQAVLNQSADSFTSLVVQANSMPQVRSEVVDAYRSRIQAGQYPTPETISGLVDVIGGSVVHLATVGSG